VEEFEQMMLDGVDPRQLHPGGLGTVSAVEGEAGVMWHHK